MTEIDKIQALYEKATPGPWKFVREGGSYYIYANNPLNESILGSDHYYPWVPVEATVEAIAALVNAWPKLRDQAALAHDLAGALRECRDYLTLNDHAPEIYEYNPECIGCQLRDKIDALLARLK